MRARMDAVLKLYRMWLTACVISFSQTRTDALDVETFIFTVYYICFSNCYIFTNFFYFYYFIHLCVCYRLFVA